MGGIWYLDRAIFLFTYYMLNRLRGFVKLKKIGVGGWFKPQLGFLGEILCFLCCFHVSNFFF